MTYTLTGIPALALQLGFIIIFAAPVWLAARVVGARHPTLLRSILSLLLGAVGSVFSLVATGFWVLLLAPLAFLLSFKWLLGTTFFGSILLAVIAAAGYIAMVHFLGHGFGVARPGIGINV